MGILWNGNGVTSLSIVFVPIFALPTRSIGLMGGIGVVRYDDLVASTVIFAEAGIAFPSFPIAFRVRVPGEVDLGGLGRCHGGKPDKASADQCESGCTVRPRQMRLSGQYHGYGLSGVAPTDGENAKGGRRGGTPGIRRTPLIAGGNVQLLAPRQAPRFPRAIPIALYMGINYLNIKWILMW
jgi:hypothetical protein